MRGGLTQSAILKRSIVLKGHKTSVTLEEPCWIGLREIAREKGFTMGGLVAQIDAERTGSNLSSALRVYVLEYYKAIHEKRAGPQPGDA